MKKYRLGEFEEIVMLTIGILNKEAYGVAIKTEIQERLSRNVSMGAMHTALVRLEGKGYIESWNGESSDDRMGRPKKYYQLTALGKKAMAYTKETRDQLWKAIPKVVLKPSN
jgi:PadR family transcriptional regulator, regulatory protein PadR